MVKRFLTAVVLSALPAVAAADDPGPAAVPVTTTAVPAPAVSDPAAAVPVTPLPRPALAPAPEPPPLFSRMATGLAACLLVGAGALVLAKKLGYVRDVRGVPGRLRVVDRVPVGPRTSVVVVEHEGRRLLLAVGPDRVTELSRRSSFDPALEAACISEA